jgi:drug/metabolite transporter (DMT)-like permease
MPRLNNAAGLLAILFAVILWGAMPFVIDAARREVPAGQLTFLKLILPGLLLSVVVGPRRIWAAVRHNWLLFLLVAGAGFALPQLFYIYALQNGAPVTLLNFIATSYPALSLLLAVVFLKERPTWLHGLATGVSLIGLYLLAGPDISAGSKAALGIFWALLSALGWAISGVAGKRITANLAPLPIVTVRHLLGAALISPMLFFEPPSALVEASPQFWMAVAALTVMSIASFYAYYRGLASTTVSTASLLESFQSVVTLFIGIAIGRPGMNTIQLAGAALVLAGAAIISAHEMKRPGKSSQTA